MRSPALFVLPLALMLALAGCTTEPDPEPSPTSTGFVTEDEAFAAAEETYRAYIDAENAVDLSDPATFEAAYALTTGDALATLREDLTAWHAERLERTGLSEIAGLQPHEADLSSGLAQLDVCLDVSNIDVVDEHGQSLVSPERVDIQRLRVTFDSTSGATLIAKSEGREDGLPCG